MILAAILAQVSAGTVAALPSAPPPPVQNVPALGIDVPALEFACKLIDGSGSVFDATVTTPHFAADETKLTIKPFNVKFPLFSGGISGRVMNAYSFDGGVLEFYSGTPDRDKVHYSVHITATRHSAAIVDVTKHEPAEVTPGPNGTTLVHLRNVFYASGFCKSNYGGN